jgi:hypothetical protein
MCLWGEFSHLPKDALSAARAYKAAPTACRVVGLRRSTVRGMQAARIR